MLHESCARPAIRYIQRRLHSDLLDFQQPPIAPPPHTSFASRVAAQISNTNQKCVDRLPPQQRIPCGVVVWVLPTANSEHEVIAYLTREESRKIGGFAWEEKARRPGFPVRTFGRGLEL